MWIDDRVLIKCKKDISLHIWTPKETRVVLGSANDFERECYVKNCEEDGIEVFRRYGGGGAVVLHSGCLVISLGLWVKNFFDNKRYFEAINQSVIDSLSSYDSSLKDLYQDGLSDLCFDGQKIAGTSLFRSRNYLLYQASILVDKKLDLINRYLQHPSKEPDYRKGKEHGAFVSDLKTILGFCELETLENKVQETLMSYLKEHLQDDLISSPEKQREHLLRKSKLGKGVLLGEKLT